ncbi:MAG TPA: tetratricopeptide repeat protein [Steroidobacteraceae bacterium]|jgi:tetratricopeptide (TPR) repeat protein|nr:tetratricopeptide repeat protein [Steroidobacteraceae bacterium]
MRGTVGFLIAACLLSGCGASGQRAHVQAASAAAGRGDYRSAELQLVAALHSTPRDADTWLQICEVQLQLGSYEAAKHALIEAGKLAAPDLRIAELRVRIDLALLQADAALHDAADRTIPALDQAVFRGRADLALERFGDAEAAYRAALALEPAAFEAHLGLADVLIRQGNAAQAAQELDELEARHPGRAEVWRLRASLWALAGRRDMVEQALATAAQFRVGQLDRPQTVSLLAALVQSQLQLGHIDAASRTAEQMGAISPQSPATQLMSGDVALAAGDFADATRHLQMVTVMAPTVLDAHRALGRSLLAQSELQDSEREFQFILHSRPGDADARHELAIVRLQKGWPAGAKEILTPLLEATPQDPQAERLAAMAEMRLDEQPQAIARLLHLADTNPRDLRAQLPLLATYLSTGAGQLADERIAPLLLAYQADAAALDALGAMLIENGEFVRADRVLTQALQADANNSQTLLLRAELALARGTVAPARAQLEALRHLDAASVPARLVLAQADLRAGRIADARAVLQEISVTGPDAAATQDSIGHVWLDAGRFAEAAACFRAASALDPRKANYWVDIAAAATGLNDLKAAAAAVGHSLSVDPKFPAALRAQVYIQLRGKLPDAALKSAEAATIALPDSATVWEVEGDVHQARAEYGAAALDYEQAARLAPSAALALKSFRAKRPNDLDGALQALLQWLKQHPGDMPVRQALAQAYESAGSYGDAVVQYQVMVDKGYEAPSMLSALALLYLHQHDPRSVSVARRAYELDPNSAASADTYGWVLLQSGQVAPGLNLLQATAQSPGASGDMRLHYAVALARSGDRKQAREIIATLLSGNSALSDRTQAEQLLKEL